MRILVLGAGGIGGYFGARLAEAGADVTFLVRAARREGIERDGLRVVSPLGDIMVRPPTVLAAEVRPAYDLVLFTCKAYDLDSAMDAIAPAMAPLSVGRQGSNGCTVLPLLNGLAHFDRLDARFGAQRVLGGTCHINATLRPDGVVVHGDRLQRIVFGERDGSASARTRAFAEVLAATRIEFVLSEDIVQDLWEKLVFLSALAAGTCLLRGNVREIVAAPGGREAMERVLEANAQIAKREGRDPRATALAAARARLTDAEGLWSASMLRDLEAGIRVEAEPIIGWMLERARAHGIDDTLLSLAYTHLKTYEARRAAGRLPTATLAGS